MAEHSAPGIPTADTDGTNAPAHPPADPETGGPGLGTLEGVHDSASPAPPKAVPSLASPPPTPEPTRLWPRILLVLAMGAAGFFGWRWYTLPAQTTAEELALPPGDAALLPDAVRAVTPSSEFAETPASASPELPPAAAEGPTHPVAVPETPVALPALAESDGLAQATLQELGAPLASWLVSENLIQTFVVTVDNLSAEKLPPHRRLVKPLGDKFLVLHEAGALRLDPANAARYAPLVNALTALDPARVAERYRAVYPLVQQAWVELGNPDSYFNDRLIVVIDHLTSAKPPAEPIALVQPKVFYRYADAKLEGDSAGRRALYRLGPEQMRRVQIWLGALREALVASAPE